MANKKSASRFCIQFNENDIQNQQVIDILNAQGRHKAQYIASAVLHYINCKETPTVPQDDHSFRQAVETIVAEIMKKQNSPLQNSAAEEKPKRKLRQSSDIGTDDAELDAATIAAINDSIAGFRSMGNE